ncbi:hypothetical protein [Nitrosopumilus piranensis]|uniref:hypothetical protein n=1 Tax=Nitrosopumilus piranensis TaxID=1582439 RepID=UPI00136456E6|nr:hypothetical protein [Nitrosopumilus piranensis]
MIITPAMADFTLSLANPSIIDSVNGSVTNIVTIGEQYMIRTDLINLQTTEQSFAYTVHIVNVEDNTELANAQLDGVLAPGEEFSPILPWEPVSCGKYIVNFAIYDDIENMNLLAPTLSLPVSIEGCPTVSPFDELFLNIQNFFAKLFA